MVVLSARGQDVNAGAGLLDSLVVDGSGWWVAARWLFLAVAVSGAGVVVALRRLSPRGQQTAADWATAVALCGLIVLAIDQVRLLSHTRDIAAAAAARPGPATDLVNISFVNLIDRTGILSFGAIGVWFLAIAAIPLPARSPAGVRILGAVTGTLLVLQPIAHGLSWAGEAGAATSGVFATAFFAWLAVALKRLPPTETDAGGPIVWSPQP